jgi:hypothetical protein
VLDSVLPHEVTHAIFATHFGRPLPRWADEGACTTVEHTSERNKQQTMLVEFLTTNRGIAFNKMFAMKEYPQDVLPLYSQGFSLTRFLIAQGGKPKFVEYVGEGMRTNNWPSATSRYYGFTDLSQLQLTWVEWVRSGSREQEAYAFSPIAAEHHPSVAHLLRGRGTAAPAARPAEQLASATQPLNSNSATPATTNVNASLAAASTPASPGPDNAMATPASFASAGKNGWYARQRDQAKQDGATDAGAPADRLASNRPVPVPQTATRPQPPEQARQVILEWSRPGPQGFGGNAGYPANGTMLR